MSDPMPPADTGLSGAVRPARLLLTPDLRVSPSEPPLRLLNPLPPALAAPAPALAPAATVLEAAPSARREAPFPEKAERPEWQDWAAEDEPEGTADLAASDPALSATELVTEDSALPTQDGLRSAFFTPPFADPLPEPAVDAATFTPSPVPAFPGTLGDPFPDQVAEAGMLSVGDAYFFTPDVDVEDEHADPMPPVSVAAWQEPDEISPNTPEEDALSEEAPSDPWPSREMDEGESVEHPVLMPMESAEEVSWPTERRESGVVADISTIMPEEEAAPASAGIGPPDAALALGVVSSIPATVGATALVDGLGPHRSEAALVEEAVLRRLVQEALREELEGALGERITRNVRKLVRAEIARALAARDLS